MALPWKTCRASIAPVRWTTQGGLAAELTPNRGGGTGGEIRFQMEPDRTAGANRLDLLVKPVVIDQRRAGFALMDGLDHAEINIMGRHCLDFDHAAVAGNHRAHQDR